MWGPPATVRTPRHGFRLPKSRSNPWASCYPWFEWFSNSLPGEKRTAPAHPRSPLQSADRRPQASPDPRKGSTRRYDKNRADQEEGGAERNKSADDTLPSPANVTTNTPDLTLLDHDIAKPILAADSRFPPYRLRLTEGLHLKTTDWTVTSVNLEEQGAWPVVEGEFIVIGDCKHTPQEIEILPGTLVNNPGRIALWLCCTHPPIYLPKNQIVAQIIPTQGSGNISEIPKACPVQAITEERPRVECEFSVGGEALHITGLLDTGADVTVVPEKDWPSHWALQNVAGHVQGVGGLQLARQSKGVVQIKGPNGQLANIRPFVLNYKEPLLGRDLMSQWGVKIDIPDPSSDFSVAVTEKRPTHKLNWLTDSPVWVEQWPLSKEKLKALEELVEEQLAEGHSVETNSPWNSPVFVIKKPGKDKWRLLHDLRQINNVIEDMGSLQPGMPSPTMLPENWNLAVIDIKDCFFQIPLHPDDAPRFAFLVPTINRAAPRRRYHWRVLPQGMKNSPVICQWVLTPEAEIALERVQECMSKRQAHRYDPGLPFKFIVMGRLPHLHGVIFQWREIPKKDRGKEDPLLIIEWVFLSHQRSKRMTWPQELVAELIRKARSRI
ncbi:hypothetical protein DUI87_04167 [Hirundo rustica rustica]|uniref:ribonuclease H n=1 Tax=Hirundo rustica rustica TaxID=333673 RepID=A0A3M0KYP2_HIRRU|nr:hypothetical protein DUI87_04167 [Hirundo rustica rustica]